MNTESITFSTKEIKVLIKSENDFDPRVDIDFKSLRFGASDEVNFGGGSELLRTEPAGEDLVLVFKGKGHGLSSDCFAAKLLGKTSEGKLLFGYSRLPGVKYIEPLFKLS